jgi:4-diphosphocytidyl-2-C-methyl-D-erythritol kinase
MGNLCSLYKELAMLTVYAPAKINLVLEVLGKDNDYHRIANIVQSIDLCDVLNFQLDEEVCFECDVPSLKRDNLITRAVTLLKESTKCSLGARIELRKHIPWGVGLGGGSSDAAATLLALNELWGLRLSLPELVQLASELGSDVPFFIHKGTALVEGKGEKVAPLPSLPSIYFVLLVPPLPKISGKTKQMYGKLNAAHYTEGRFIQQALSYLKQGRMIGHSCMFNVFEEIAFAVVPGLDKYRKTLEEAGAPGVYLAGSGPCLFTFFSEERQAKVISLNLRGQGLECYVTSPFPGG